MKAADNRVIRLIAIFKLLKAATLIAIGVGALKLLHGDSAATVQHGIERLGLDPGGRWLDRALAKLASVTPRAMRDLGVVSFVYAGLFFTEGAGLWLGKRWAEWFTVVITASLVPVEVWELIRHPTALKVLVLTINVAVVVYLLVRLRREQRE